MSFLTVLCNLCDFPPSGGQTLQIPRVQLEDAGKYTCQAVNEAGEDRMHFDLEVLGKDHISPHTTCHLSVALQQLISLTLMSCIIKLYQQLTSLRLMSQDASQGFISS